MRAGAGRPWHHPIAECGPGKVLTGLVKRIDKAIDGRSLATPGDFEAAREAWSA
jgi:[acyl-carrier-protein] S-malonyltransferase